MPWAVSEQASTGVVLVALEQPGSIHAAPKKASDAAANASGRDREKRGERGAGIVSILLGWEYHPTLDSRGESAK
jgi:hypothetical protein